MSTSEYMILLARADNATKQRDELLAALKHIMNYTDTAPLAAKHMAGIAQQAIAKAKGEIPCRG